LSPDCGDCPIRHRAVCARCETDELAQLEEMKYYRSFEAGQTVIWSGDRMDFVASVVTGIATLTQTMEDGRRQIVGLLLPSDFVGRPGRETAAYDVTATTDLVMCCFRKKPFEAMMLSTPHIGQRLLEMTLDELDAAREWMLLLGRKTAREKIASLIAIIARRHARWLADEGQGGRDRPAADARGDVGIPGPDAGNREPADLGPEARRRDRGPGQAPRHHPRFRPAARGIGRRQRRRLPGLIPPSPRPDPGASERRDPLNESLTRCARPGLEIGRKGRLRLVFLGILLPASVWQTYGRRMASVWQFAGGSPVRSRPGRFGRARTDGTGRKVRRP
jgi:CRP-like cAMP-binding protein